MWCLVCLSLELVGPCVVLGFSVSMEAFDELLSIMFLGVRSSLESGFGLKPPTSFYTRNVDTKALLIAPRPSPC